VRRAVDIRAAGSRFEADTPRELFEVADLHPEARRNRYVFAPDGQRFLIVTSPQGQDSSSMNVIVNWQSQLQRWSPRPDCHARSPNARASK
jgi:hypothetical protein